jgi:hypothetical protein
MDTGSQTKLPAVIVVFRFPFNSQGGLCGSFGTHRGKPVKHKAACKAAGALPRVAFDFNAQRAAIVGTGPRKRGQSERGYQTANCNLP